MRATFIGQKLSQTKEAIQLWEDFLNRNDFSRIIEFGTYKWGMSMLFKLFCIQKGAEFYTYDVSKLHLSKLGKFLGLDKDFKKADIFSIEKEIGDIIKKPGATLLYCDNGNKPKEVEVFAKYLKRGDWLAVHDWETEIELKDIPQNLKWTFVMNSDPKTAIFQCWTPA